MNGDTGNVHDGDLRTEGGSVPVDFDALKTLPGLRAVDNWTLDADEGLLEFLRGFSDRMLTRMNQVHDQVDELVYETKASEARLYNTFNEFIMLSNTQFIENRIYEEDIDMQSQQKQQEHVQEHSGEKKTSDEQAGLNFSTAIKYGLKALEVCSVPLEDDDMYLDDDGSFNEEPQQQKTQPTSQINVESHYKQQTAMLKERTLPFIIGTTEFFEDDMVGLNPDEENENVVEGIGEDYNNALGNVSDGMAPSSGSIPPPPPPPPMMGSGNIPPPPPLPSFGEPNNTNLSAPPPFKLDSTSNLFGEDDEDDNLFGVPSSSENLFGGSDNTAGAHRETNASEPKKPMDIREQLALAMANKFQKPTSEEEQHTVSQETSSGSVWNNDEAEDGGLFGSSKSDPFSSNLFGADSTSVSKQKPSHRDDDIFDLGELEASISGSKSSSSAAAKSKKEAQPAKVGFAFDFEDDTGDSLFGGDDVDIMAKPKAATTTTATTDANKKAQQKSSNSLFGFDDEDDDFDSILSGTKKETPKQTTTQTAQSVSSTATKSSSLFGLDDDDDDMFAPSSKKTVEPSKPVAASTQPKKPASTLFGFDDDEDDLDFGALGAKKTEPKKSEPVPSRSATSTPTTTTSVSKKTTSSLFQDDEEDDDFNFVSKDREVKKKDPKDTPKHQAAKKMPMWDEEDDDLDILAAPTTKKAESPAASASKTTETTKKEVEEQKPKVTVVPPKVDEDTLSSEEATPKTVKPSSMNKSAFAASIMKGLNMNVGGGPSKTISRIRSESRPEAPQPSLLDHDSESIDPLIAPASEENKKAPSPAKESLFSEQPKQSEEVKPVTQPAVSSSKIPKGAVSMFGGPVTASVPKKSTVTREQKEEDEQPKKDAVTNYARDGGGGQTLTHMSLARPKRSKRQPAKKTSAKPSISLSTATTTTVATPAASATTTKKSSLFDDDVDDLDEFVAKAPAQAREVKPVEPQKKKSSLFDDGDDEFDFIPKKAPEQPKPAALQKTAVESTKETKPPAKKTTSLFGESDDEDFAPLPSKKKPEPAQADTTPNSSLLQSHVDEHSDIISVQKEVEIPVEEVIKTPLTLPKEETAIEQPVPETTPETTVEVAKLASEPSSKSEDDLVLSTRSSTQKSFTSKKKAETEEKKKKASALFQDDDDLLAAIPAPKKQEVVTSKQPAVKSNANDLINDLLSGVETKKTTVKKPAAKASAIDDDLFSSVPTTKKPAAKKTTSSTTVDDLLSIAPKKTATVAKKPTTNSSDLFGDLPASTTKKNSSAAKKTATKKAASTAAKGLFDGDDDIFAAPVAKKTGTAATKKPAAKKVDTSGLFDF